MALRHRRGNYTILFVLTGTVMLSYLAFSIDGGRMQVAKLDGENAAEAAALAAMVAIRDGGDENDAAIAAGLAANQVDFQNTYKAGKSPAPNNTVSVEIDWGRWNWEAARTTLDSRWDVRRDGIMPQAVSVDVKTTGSGVRSIFGAAVGMAAGGSTNQFANMQVGAGVRAAFRNRDIVVVVDTSRFDEPHIDGIQDGIQGFLDALVDNGVPGDNFALVAYAGAGWVYDLRNPGALDGGDPTQLDTTFAPAEPTQPFVSVQRDNGIARETLGRVEPCNVGSDAFLHAIRHTRMGGDNELSASFLDYYAIEPRPTNTAEAQFQWAYDDSPSSIQTLLMAYGQMATTFNAASWNRALNVPDQCAVWFFVETLPFLFMDPRRDRLVNTALGVRSPLECHAGNPYEGRNNRWRVDSPIPSVECGFDPLPTGESRYASPVNAPVMYQDLAYFQAGSNPGRGLQRAQEILANRTTNGEPVVVLVSGTYPRCGPNIDEADIPGCDDLFLADTSTALEALDNAAVTTHVVSIAPAGSQTDVQMSTFTTGRGKYLRVGRGDQTIGALQEIAHDLRVQVVR